MKKIKKITLLIIALTFQLGFSQDGRSLILVHNYADKVTIDNIANPTEGNISYNIDDKNIYVFDGTNWVLSSETVTTFSQNASGTITYTNESGDTFTATTDSSNIYNTDGTLTGNRTMTMDGNDLTFLSNTSNRATLSLERANGAPDIGIGFKNQDGTYRSAIALTGNGDQRLNFFTGSNTNVASLTNTLSLNLGGQIQLPEYGNASPNFGLAGNTLSYLLGVLDNGRVVEIEPDDVGTDDQNALEVSYNPAGSNGSNPIVSTTVREALNELSNRFNANSISVEDTAGNYAATNVEGVLTEIANTLSADDDQDPINEIQDITLTGDTLTISDNASSTGVDLSIYLDDTDEQEIETLTYDSSNGELTLKLENSDAATVTITSSDEQEIENLTSDSATGELSIKLENSDTETVTINVLDANVYLDTPIDVDGDTTTIESTAKEVIDAIAPITSKAARIFYPPSIAIDADATSTNNQIDLYQLYINEFGTPLISSGGNAPPIPTYGRTELYYYVTNYDTGIIGIDAATGLTTGGVLTYDIIAIPDNDNTILNIVFVVK